MQLLPAFLHNSPRLRNAALQLLHWNFLIKKKASFDETKDDLFFFFWGEIAKLHFGDGEEQDYSIDILAM